MSCWLNSRDCIVVQATTPKGTPGWKRWRHCLLLKISAGQGAGVGGGGGVGGLPMGSARLGFGTCDSPMFLRLPNGEVLVGREMVGASQQGICGAEVWFGQPRHFLCGGCRLPPLGRGSRGGRSLVDGRQRWSNRVEGLGWGLESHRETIPFFAFWRGGTRPPTSTQH